MTQYQDPFAQPYMDPSMQPKKTSGMAITALVFSLVGIVPCCGIIPALIGVLLGLIGFATLGPMAAKKGRGLCIAAIIIGVVFTALWGYFIGSGYKDYLKMQDTPALAIRAAESGDIAKFRQTFTASGATDEEATAFVASLNSRYGRIVSSELDLNAFMQRMQSAQGQQVLPFRFKLVFDKSAVDAELMFDPSAQRSDDMVFDSITVFDSSAGDLSFPASAAPSGSPAPSGQPQPAGGSGAPPSATSNDGG